LKYLLIASRLRSGTHFLKSLLGSCDKIVAINEEPFHADWSCSGNPGFWDGKTEIETWLLDQAKLEQPHKNPELIVFCCHPKHYQPEVLPTLNRIVNYVICLHRNNLLAQYISYKLAEMNWAWSTAIGTPKAVGTIFIYPSDFMYWCQSIYTSLEIDRARWKDRIIANILYEALSENHQLLMQDIGYALELDTSMAIIKTEKHEIRDLKDVVLNYEEARKWEEDFKDGIRRQDR
jgi:hypothetical protein